MPNLNILVVDDEEAIRDMLVMVLENAGIIVIAVASAEDAQKTLAKNLPDLMLLDWMLPGISGIELARRLKYNDKYKNLAIILLSARSEEIDRNRAFEAGVNDYVTKPFSPKDLIARIRIIGYGNQVHSA